MMMYALWANVVMAGDLGCSVMRHEDEMDGSWSVSAVCKAPEWTPTYSVDPVQPLLNVMCHSKWPGRVGVSFIPRGLIEGMPGPTTFRARVGDELKELSAVNAKHEYLMVEKESMEPMLRMLLSQQPTILIEWPSYRQGKKVTKFPLTLAGGVNDREMRPAVLEVMAACNVPEPMPEQK